MGKCLEGYVRNLERRRHSFSQVRSLSVVCPTVIKRNSSIVFSKNNSLISLLIVFSTASNCLTNWVKNPSIELRYLKAYASGCISPLPVLGKVFLHTVRWEPTHDVMIFSNFLFHIANCLLGISLEGLVDSPSWNIDMTFGCDNCFSRTL